MLPIIADRAQRRPDVRRHRNSETVRTSARILRNSIRHVLGLLSGVTLALSGYLGVLILLSGHSETYTTVHVGEWYARKVEALEKTPSPRVLFVGGSNVLYGIDAESFQRLTGVRAVNAGTHAALHPAYFFDWIRRHARPGDVVVLSLEHHIMYAGEPTSILANYLVNRDLSAVWRLPPRVGLYALIAMDWDQLLLETWRNATPSWKGGIEENVKKTVAETIGPLGDYRGHSRHGRGAREEGLMATIKPEDSLAGPAEVDANMVADLRTLKHWCDEHAVRLVGIVPATLDFPAYHAASASEGHAAYAQTYRWAGIPLLQEPAAEMRPPDEFFDSIYHLTYEAMQAHTQRLADLLASVLPG